MSDRKQGKGRKRKAPPTKAEVKAAITAAFKEAGKRNDTPTARRIAAAKRHNVEMDSRPQSGMLTVATNAPAKPMSDERLAELRQWIADQRPGSVLGEAVAEIDRLRAEVEFLDAAIATFDEQLESTGKPRQWRRKERPTP